MKVGDLVMRTNELVRSSLATGIIIKIQESGADNLPFYQVMWSSELANSEGLYWYGRPELEVISESR